jgi:prolyl-tRNA synthetase
MRASHWFLATLKEIPKDAELVSHQLMLRTGMIRKLGSGLYTWMPLGLKVLRKVEQIVREEMTRIHCNELLMPSIQPAELWQETGRWETFGDLLLTMSDSNGREYCYGPTHEEVITDIMRNELQSYKQLPVCFYQIQTKFRDEIRPRFGVMRAREFIMKDAYSFHLDLKSLEETYKKMYQAYCDIFDRIGLKYRAVEADTGAIGGFASHEFQVLADSGEDLIFYSDASTYAANREQATSLNPPKSRNPTTQPIALIDTPNQKTIAEVSQFLKISPSDMIKTLIVRGQNHPLIALVLRGDDELNELKAAKHPLVYSPLEFINEETVLKDLKAPVGSIGPVDLSIPIIVDHCALSLDSFVCGANQANKHYQHVAWDKDIKEYQVYDLRTVKEGDPSPDGIGLLRSCRGIEVGHVFQLGDKYAKAMNACVLNVQGQLESMMMGCYGLGISRVVAATIEQHHDDQGIIWPINIAPFQVVIIPLNAQKSTPVKETVEILYEQFCNAGIEVLLDDRNERAGALFADHDLIGIPHRLIVSERTLENNGVEYKSRATGASKSIDLGNVVKEMLHLISQQ